MTGRICAVGFLMSLFVFGCAKPKYDTSKVDNSPSKDAKTMSCDLTFSQTGYCLSWSWQKMPTQQDAGIIEFYIFKSGKDGESQSVVLEKIPGVVLWMPDMGHGSAPTHVEEVELGHYLARDVIFVMPGTWQIKFQAQFKNENGEVVDDEAVAEVSI